MFASDDFPVVAGGGGGRKWWSVVVGGGGWWNYNEDGDKYLNIMCGERLI